MSADDFERELAGAKGVWVLWWNVNRGVDRHGVPTVTSMLIGSRCWLYNINIQ